MSTKIAEIEARRAARRAETEKQKTEQLETDLAAIDALEAEHGDECVAALKVNGYRPGLPVMVGVIAPSEPVYRRFVAQIRKAGKNTESHGAAQDQLARSCLAYPPKEDETTRGLMLDAFPGLLVSVAIEAQRLAELRSEAEGKG